MPSKKFYFIAEWQEQKETLGDREYSERVHTMQCFEPFLHSSVSISLCFRYLSKLTLNRAVDNIPNLSFLVRRSI
jgi:hypothetical protein